MLLIRGTLIMLKQENKHKVNFWKFIFKYLKKYRLNLSIAVVCSIITGAVVALQPLIIKYIVDDGIEGLMSTNSDKLKFVGLMCIIYIAISLARVCSWKIGYKNLLASLEGTMLSIRADLFSSIQQKCMRFYEKNSSGELYNYIMGSPISNIKLYIDKMIMTLPYQLVAFGISITALISYNWVLTLIMLAIAISMTALNFFSKKKIRAAAKEYLNAEKETSKHMADILNGISAVKLYSIEDTMMSEFNTYFSDYKEKGMKFTLLNTTEILKPEFVQYLGTALIYFVGALFCLYGEGLLGGLLTTGMLYAFLSSMGSILSILNGWFTLSFQRSAAETALEKIVAVLDEKTSTPEVSAEKMKDISREEAKARNQGKPCIEFKNVKFSYDERPIFTDFSCKIKYGESIGLVGGSGSGKSTFTKLVMRLYDTDNGDIFLHGRNVKDYPTHDLRASFGVVPQSPFIFYGTVLSNIKITNPNATDDEVRRAMDIAHVSEFVDEMPNGVNTIIGDGAVSLSGGQRQRIAIARAVLKKPDILIFDEATSALDNRSERLVQAAIEELMKDHTIIIVAHRLSTIKNVDRILLFDNGEIVEEGSYEELEALHGEFYNLLHIDEMSKT